MPSNPNGQAPVEVSLEGFDLQSLYDANGAYLEDEILLSYAGKAKTITQGNGDTVDISPSFKGTLTNLESGDVFEFVATGSIRYSDNGDGTLLITYNGLNLVGNPYLDDGSYALVQTRGHFSNVYDEASDPAYGPLDGHGQILFIVDDLVS